VATGKPKPYNAFNSGPSNTGPTNVQLITDIKARIALLLKTTPGLKTGQIPIDLVESSGSGLDPDISVQAALIQVPRVALHTHLSRAFLTELVQDNVRGLDLGVFGRSRVNVLELNLALYKALHSDV
jgi:K+-transporting ATPase ATPase C chain